MTDIDLKIAVARAALNQIKRQRLAATTQFHSKERDLHKQLSKVQGKLSKLIKSASVSYYVQFFQRGDHALFDSSYVVKNQAMLLMGRYNHYIFTKQLALMETQHEEYLEDANTVEDWVEQHHLKRWSTIQLCANETVRQTEQLKDTLQRKIEAQRIVIDQLNKTLNTIKTDSVEKVNYQWDGAYLTKCSRGILDKIQRTNIGLTSMLHQQKLQTPPSTIMKEKSRPKSQRNKMVAEVA